MHECISSKHSRFNSCSAKELKRCGTTYQRMHVFYISCFVLDRGGPLCFRYICKLIPLYPCRLFHCMYSFVCADRKQLKIDAEQVLGMRLHNLYGVLSMHERIASSKSHFTTYMFYFLRTCSMFPGSTEALSLQFLTMHHVSRWVE